ncbi:MAG: ATP-binding protein [Planctomycetaceae bacterium]
MVPEARLLVVQGVDQGRRFEITRSPIHIGRGLNSDVRLFDTESSRRHAALVSEEDRWRIIDEGSSNGTFVNGQPVSEAVLESGDQIQVGRTILLFSDLRLAVGASPAETIDLTDDPQSASQIVGSLDSAAALPLERQAALQAAKLGKPDANLELLYRISEEVVRPAESLDQLLRRILDLTLDAVQADRGVMFVFDSRTDRIEPRVVSVRSGRLVNTRFPVSQTIVEYVVQRGQGILTSDASHDERFEEGNSILRAGIREAMCIPMQGRYELLGAIYVDTTMSPQDLIDAGTRYRFSSDHLAVMLAIGRQSALAVESHRYQEALVSAERFAAVGQTVAMLGHDIKNILQGMRGGSYLIDRGLKTEDDELVRKGWGIHERNQERIFNLVMDMLSFSKDRPPRLKGANVNDTIREVCDLLQPQAAEQSTALVASLGGDVPRSLFDPDGLHRVILNVLTNALEALDGMPDGRVEVRSRFDEAGQQILIDVADNGPGIPEEHRPNLFNLFVSGKGAQGTGLGLAVCRKILREHGGDIEVDSEAGVGATFRLWLPYHEEDVEGSSVHRAAEVQAE